MSHLFLQPSEEKKQKEGNQGQSVSQLKKVYNNDEQEQKTQFLSFNLQGNSKKETSVKQCVSATKANETGIPDQIKAKAEQLSGMTMDDVRVHYNSDKPAQVQALAYTQGTDIHVAPGQEKHIGHELGHVVQQKQGRVKPTVMIAGNPVNDAEGLEKEADDFGRKL